MIVLESFRAVIDFILAVYYEVRCHMGHHDYVRMIRDDVEWCVHCGCSPDA